MTTGEPFQHQVNESIGFSANCSRTSALVLQDPKGRQSLPNTRLNHPRARPPTALLGGCLALGLSTVLACETTAPDGFTFETFQLRDAGVRTSNSPASIDLDAGSQPFECDSGSCLENMQCLGVDSGPACECRRGGEEGVSCLRRLENDEASLCENTTCLNGGACSNGPDGAVCECPSGFDGLRCEANSDDCLPNPCQNGGTCIDAIGDFVCECASDFEGKACEIIIERCEVGTCQNGGECSDTDSGVVCDCAPDFDGLRCERQIDDCLDVECLNGGTCIDGVVSSRCECLPGFEPPLCLEVDECAPEPCQNGGECSDRINGFECGCQGTGFRGDTCTIPIIRPNGDTCGTGTQCASGNCVTSTGNPNVSICCSSACDGGVCAVQGNTTSCRGPAGFACDNDRNCADGDCRQFFRDEDNDGFAVAGAILEGQCFAVGLQGVTTQRPSPGNIDCLGNDPRVHPGVLEFESAGASGVGSFDYNCDGEEEPDLPPFDAAACIVLAATEACASVPQGFDPALPPICGQTSPVLTCQAGAIPGTCEVSELAPPVLVRCR